MNVLHAAHMSVTLTTSAAGSLDKPRQLGVLSLIRSGPAQLHARPIAELSSLQSAVERQQS
jgi:hypothetical protein